VRFLILGAGGMLGRQLASTPPPGETLAAYDRSRLDVRDAAALRRALDEQQPDWVLNASGFTDVDAAEHQPDLAFAINATAVGELARACAERGVALAHFSTDYVFPGKAQGYYSEHEPPRPVSAYGRSKLAGEEAVAGSGAKHLVIRTQWLYGAAETSRRRPVGFVDLMWKRAKDGLETRVVDDQFGCCTWVVDLAAAVWRVLPLAEGMLHIAGRGCASRFEIAQHIFAAVGREDLVKPCATSELGAKAPRPFRSPLSVSRYERLTGERMPAWSESLDRYLALGLVDRTPQ
jgi:dTDP-4-dehydrorhamnose reductase